MAVSLLTRINIAAQKLEQLMSFIITGRRPPDALCLVGIEVNRFPRPTIKFPLEDIKENGFLWAVPKSRRTIEKRLKRKFGHPDYVWKLLTPKTHLKTCNVCGDHHEAGVLCPTCYKKVIDETKVMQEAIQNELKLEPVENEIVVLYEGEKEENTDFEGKRIVEIDKPRPKWFSKNLLQQSTQKQATTTEVKPSDLG